MRLAGALVLVVLVASACGDGTGTPGVPPPDGIAESCPPWDRPIRYAEGDLPEGAESVRLCPGPPIVAYDGTIYDAGIQPPELLTSRVDEVVEAVNDLEGVPDGTACPGDGGSRLTYWFSYPDGDARAVTYENFGCEELVVGERSRRAEGNRVARAFTEALLAQRAAASPPQAAVEAPDCRGVHADPRTTLPTVPADLAAATLCVEAGGRRVRAAEVPAGTIDRLNEGLLDEPMDWSECGDAPLGFATLLGRTRWGDLVRYVIDGCGRVGVTRPPGWLREEEQAFRLPSDLAAELDALPLGPVVRVDSPVRKTAPPATPG